jgi:ADP-ribose pyrophosphatase YjhB (NUDIX family)
MTYPFIKQVIDQPIGYLVKSILVSGFIVPIIKPISSLSYKSYYINQYKIKIFDVFRKSGDFDSDEISVIFSKLFAKQLITRSVIQGFDDNESAVFILGLQFYFKNINLDDGLETYDFLEIASKASELKWYRELLLMSSLSFMNYSYSELKKFVDKVLEKKNEEMRVRHSTDDADIKFYERLVFAKRECITVFSATSQVSNVSLSIIRDYAKQIKEIKYFLVSPLIYSDESLEDLKDEYDLPDFVLPKGQFLNNSDLDLLRRVIRIINSIEKMYDYSKELGLNVQLYLYKRRYPGIKVRILSERTYMQLFPGSLKYANNLYRFGVSITDKEIIEKVELAVDTYVGKEHDCYAVILNDENFDLIRNKALKEIVLYLIRSGANVEQIDEFRSQFRFVLKDGKVDWYLEQVNRLWSGVNRFLSDYDISDVVENYDDIYKKVSKPQDEREGIVAKKDERLGLVHMSVGLLLINEGKILLIKKSKYPYRDKISFVAGHVEWGESPFEAIKREVKEEIGVELCEISLVRYYDNISEYCRYGASKHEWYVFQSNQNIDTSLIVTNIDEVSEFFWVNLEDISKIEKFTSSAKKILTDLSLL